MSHRRARHITLATVAALGAHLFLDARKGAATAGTWTDLSGNGRNATQGTGAKQPTLTANIRAGNPVVRFDGGDGLATAAYAPSVASTKLVVFAASANGILMEHGTSASAANGSYIYTSNLSSSNHSGPTGFLVGSAKTRGVDWGIGSVWRIVRSECDGTNANHKFFINGAVQSMTADYSFDPGTAASSHTMNVGARNNGASVFLTGDIAAAGHFIYISNTLARRLEQSLALTWKIACS